MTAGITPRQIIARVAAEHGVSPADIAGKARKARIVAARFAAIHTVKEAKPAYSLTQIANHFGHRHHTTILHALRKVESDGVPLPPAALMSSRDGEAA